MPAQRYPKTTLGMAAILILLGCVVAFNSYRSYAFAAREAELRRMAAEIVRFRDSNLLPRISEAERVRRENLPRLDHHDRSIASINARLEALEKRP